MVKWILFITVIFLAGAYNACCWLPRRVVPHKKKRRILCIGDSITFGAGVVMTRWKDAWPAILNRKLGHQYQVMNYGISGATAQEGTDKAYSPAFRAAAMRTEPELCIFMLGTNDSKPHNWDIVSYEQSVSGWIADLRARASHPKIILTVPPAAFPVDGSPIAFSIRDEVIRDEIRPLLFHLAERENVGLLDLYEATRDHPEWFADGVHPNEIGNLAIADLIRKAINNKENEQEDRP